MAEHRSNLIRRLFRAVLGARLPTHEGAIRVPGIARCVTIGRDAFGVPYVEAADARGAWFGLGFCHGQDRAGQLELLLRIVRGTLAEVAGADGVAFDRLARRIGFTRAAPAQLAAAPPEVQAQLDAYAAGLNAGITRGARRRAHEFTLLRCAPSTWRALDVQALFSFLCFTLASNWDIELLRLKILEADGADALRALDPAYPAHLPVTAPGGAPAGVAVDHLARDLLRFHDAFDSPTGSNAWALSGARTASGRPIVANDPHMPPATPALWYLARLTTPAWSVCGGTFIGTPGFACGHNGYAAWGVTAAHADNTDLFIEELGDDGRSVRDPSGAFVPCERVEERVVVRGGDDITLEVLITPRGPIVSGEAMPAAPRGGPRHALSLAATWLAPRPYVGLTQVHRARSFAEFRALFDGSAQASASMIYADVGTASCPRGRIGWTLAVELPRRKSGGGTVPLPAWDPGAGWDPEPVPFASIPHAVDPPAGFLAAANNQPSPHSPNSPDDDARGDVFLGLDWLDGYRQAAIVRRLKAREDWDIRSTQALQRDTTSLPWAELREVVLGVAVRGGGRAARAQALLRAWDGQVGRDSVGAAVYCSVVAALCRRIVVARAPNSARWALGEGFTELLPHNLIVTRRLGHLVGLVRAQDDAFFAGCPGLTWAGVLEDALAESIALLEDRLGRDPAGWSWGRLRPITLEHLLGALPGLDRVFNVPGVRLGGDSSTVSQGTFCIDDVTRNAVAIPSLRAVIDVGAWDRSRFSLAGGQAGNPFSDNYADLLEHHDLGGIPIAWSEAETERRIVRRLELVPE